MNGKIMIVTTTFNNQEHIFDLIKSCAGQTYQNFELVIADDGSTDYTNHMIEDLMKEYSWITHIRLPHGERGIARYKAIHEALEKEFEYLMIVDSDMQLESNLLKEAVKKINQANDIGALVIKEIPVSKFHNPMTKVKLFERKVINNAYKVDNHSVEAARFWKRSEYESTGGINPSQISFEEIQPTIRYRAEGGRIERLTSSGLIHDEKKVTFRNLMAKKKYHFEMMPKTLTSEKDGFLKALSRWYFFRPVLYQPNNLIQYIKHPLLTIGMTGMYIVLTGIGVQEILKQILFTNLSGVTLEK